MKSIVLSVVLLPLLVFPAKADMAPNGTTNQMICAKAVELTASTEAFMSKYDLSTLSAEALRKVLTAAQEATNAVYYGSEDTCPKHISMKLKVDLELRWLVWEQQWKKRSRARIVPSAEGVK